MELLPSYDAFAHLRLLAVGGGRTSWTAAKRDYLRGLETRAKLGALDAYVAEGMAPRGNVFPTREAAEACFAPEVVAEAIVRQNFNAQWLRLLCHAAVWVSYTPVPDGITVSRYFVLRLYSHHAAILTAAKLIYGKGNSNDQVLPTEAPAGDAPSTPVP